MGGVRGGPGRPRACLHEAGRRARSPQQPPPPGGAEMIWLTWRQFRTQALSAAAALAVFAILLAATGPHMASLYAASGLSGCRGGSCQNLAGSFEAQLQSTAIYPALYLISV